MSCVLPNLSIHFSSGYFTLQKDVAERSCTVRVEMSGHLVRMQITFPAHYPNGAAPSFAFDKSTTIDNGAQGELVKVVM